MTLLPANNSSGHTTHSAPVRISHTKRPVLHADDDTFVDEWVGLHCSYHPGTNIDVGLQITKWDEQRENGTFPASLEP